jgi:hypothetical protein
MSKFKLGDYVKEKDGRKIGFVIHLVTIKDGPPLVVVRWPPSREGFGYHQDDLVALDEGGGR